MGLAPHREYVVSLYLVRNELIEVYYSMEEQQVTRISTAASADLDKYLPSIHLPALD